MYSTDGEPSTIRVVESIGKHLDPNQGETTLFSILVELTTVPTYCLRVGLSIQQRCTFGQEFQPRTYRNFLWNHEERAVC